jgi:CRISPR/Cas system CSM-associated protein Csm2 small subunit
MSCSNGKQNVPLSIKEEKEFNFGSISQNNFLSFWQNHDHHEKEKKEIWKKIQIVLTDYPIIVSDYAGGIISTDWFQKNKNEKYKISVYISSSADKLTISTKVFRKILKKGFWVQIEDDKNLSEEIKNKISPLKVK